jgi:hypothetical protein
LILDPLAPNWEIEQASFPDQPFPSFAENETRVYAGGAGEARRFHQRAKELMRQNGYDGYHGRIFEEGWNPRCSARSVSRKA